MGCARRRVLSERALCGSLSSLTQPDSLDVTDQIFFVMMYDWEDSFLVCVSVCVCVLGDPRTSPDALSSLVTSSPQGPLRYVPWHVWNPGTFVN